MASTSFSRVSRQARKRFFTRDEVIEMIQTEGSDAEMVEDFDSDTDFEPDGLLGEENGSEVDSDPAGTPPRENVLVETPVHPPSPPPPVHVNDDEAFGNDVGESEDDFIRFMSKDWHGDFSFFPCVPPYVDENAGLHLSDAVTDHTPLRFFEEIWNEAIIDTIVEETNRYAAQTIPPLDELPKDSIFRQWEDITRRDLIGFFAILVHIGLVHKPDIKDYWCVDPILQTSFAARIMPRNKFMRILILLHISNNDEYILPGQEGHDRLHKIRLVYDHLRSRFRDLYTPGENICIDEAICAWRGKLKFRVYMKDKPVKWGIKMYELCESASAYVYDFEIFAGIPDLSNRPVDVVMRLADPLLDAGRSVYVDNYYCCPELADKLVVRDTHCVGTVRSNRKGMPKQFSKPLQRGQVHGLRQGNLYVLIFYMQK